MAEITITDDDRAAAEAFMQSFLEDLFPDADFSRGSITRDHTIAAIAAVVSFFRAEARNTRRATSLRRAPELTGTDFTQAVENIVSNWFVTRREGTRVRGIVTLHFSQPHDGFVPPSATFTKTAGVQFNLDSQSGIAFSTTDLSPRTNATGAVVDYTYEVPVVANSTGTIFQVGAGPFAAFTQFDPYLTFVENVNDFTGGTDEETADELLRRVPEAITVRDLNSERSIQAVLQEEFPEILRTLVIGMAEPGMQRDVLELLAPDIIIHLGGYIDVYIATELAQQRTYEAAVGSTFTDPRIEVTLFRDEDVQDWRDLNIEPGDVLRHQNFDTGEAALYNIREVTKYYLKVSKKQAFPSVRPVPLRLNTTGDHIQFADGTTTASTSTIASANADFTQDDVGRYVRIETDPATTANGDYLITAVNTAVDPPEATLVPLIATTVLIDDTSVPFRLFEKIVLYSIGDVGPDYANKVGDSSTGEFTRDFQEVGKVLLPGEPIYRIREVSILDPADPDANALTQRVEFPVRVNKEPTKQSGDNLQYRMDVVNPLEHQSTRQLATIDVGFAVEQTGANAGLDNSNRFTAPGALFTAEDVGKLIRITDAVLANNRGEFEIDTFVSSTEVDLIDPDDGGWTSQAEIQLSWELSNKNKYDGKTMRIVYDTITNFDVISAFLSERNRRVICADTLARGYHPVYLDFEVIYRLSESATADVDENEVKTFLVDFINTFPTNDVINASDIVTAIQSTFPAIGSVRLPLVINFDLHAPDGRVIPYTTQDAIEIDEAFLASGDANNRLEDPESISVIDDNVRYLTDVDLITLTQVL